MWWCQKAVGGKEMIQAPNDRHKLKITVRPKLVRINLYKECKVLYRVQKGRIVIQFLEIYVAIYFSFDPKLI